MATKNLYTNTAIFRLTIDGISHQIAEPIKWDGVKIKLMRDPKLYGMNAEFSEDETALQFPKGQGYELIKEQYDLLGSDAIIEFSFSYLDRLGNETTVYEGTLNLNSYEVDDLFVYTTIEKQSFNNLLRTRYETKVSFNAKETLDGEVLPVPDLVGGMRNYGGLPVSYSRNGLGILFDTSYDMFFYHELTELIGSDIREFASQNLFVVGGDEPTYQDYPQIVVEKTDYYTFDYSFSGIFKFDVRDLSDNPVASAPIVVRPYLKVYRGTSFVVDEDHETYTITTTTYQQANSIDISYQRSLTLNVGDKVMFGVKFFINSALGKKFKGIQITNYQNEFKLTKPASELDYPFRGFLMKLHSKEITRYSETKTPATEPDTYSETGVALTDAWLQLDTETVLTSEIEGLVNVPLGIITTPPLDTDQYIFKAVEDGTVNYQFTFSGRFQVPGATASTLTYTPCIITKRAGATTIKGYPAKAVTVTGVNIRDFVMAFDVSDVLDVLIDDEVYFGCRINCAIIGNVNITNAFSNVKISQATVADGSTCRAYNLLDAIKFVVKVITGADSDRVISSFLGSLGCAEKYAVTNGFQIRNFEVSDRPVQASLKDLVESASAIWNLGMGLKTDSFGTDYIMIEPMDSFYSGDEILTINEVYDYKEEHDKDKVFNQLQIGYAKYADDANNFLDDVHTQHEYLLPIKTYKATKQIESKFITSGYLIEEQRRSQFADTPSKSVANDDELFLISYIKDFRQFDNVIFGVDEEGTTGTFRFSRTLGLVAGNKFTITGGVNGDNDGIVYTIISKDDFQEIYYTSPAPQPDLGTATIRVLIATIEAEKNENYDTLNILTPTSAYNLSITPKQMLFWWDTYLNVGLTKKQKSDIIKNTFVKQNKDAVLIPLSDSPCQVLPSEGIAQDADVALENFRYLNRPYTPTKCTFKAKLPFTDINKIRKATRGELVDISESFRNFGYIVFPDSNGVEQQGHVESMEYSPMTDETTIVCYKIDEN